MEKTEKTLGIVWLGVHAALLPWLLTVLYTKVLQRMHVELTGPSLNLIYYVISFAFVLIFLFRFLKKSFGDLFDKPLQALQAIALGYLFNWAAIFLISLLLNTVNPNQQEILRQAKLDPNVMIVIAVLLAPLVEETLFRGALFGTLRAKSRLLAYIVSTLLFAAYHLWQYPLEWSTLLYLLQYIPASIALAWCYERSGSIWAPIVLHAAINFVSIQVTLG
jgi:membrane protease YdiL (CAAX protease family)